MGSQDALGNTSAAAGTLLLILFAKVQLHHGPSANYTPCFLAAPWTRDNFLEHM